MSITTYTTAWRLETFISAMGRTWHFLHSYRI